MSVTDELLKNNEAYAACFTEGPHGHGGVEVAVVACMDARMDVYAILGLRRGQAHVIRNAGGVVTDDTIRSLLISQQLLGTQEVILIHHTDCGMLKIREDDVKADVQARCGFRPPFSLEAFSDLEDDVRQSLARVHASPFLPRTDQIHGFIYDVETGRLREVKP